MKIVGKNEEEREENTRVRLYFNLIKLFEGNLKQYERVTGLKYEKLGPIVKISRDSRMQVTDYHKELYQKGVEALVNCHNENEQTLLYCLNGGLNPEIIEGIPIKRLIKDSNITSSKKKSLKDKIKDFTIPILYVTGLGFLIYSSVNMFYDKFTADVHKQIRNEDIIEEIYGFDRDKNGEIEEIRVYAGTATPRGAIITPFTYHPSDKEFNDKLRLLTEIDQ